MKTSFLLPTLLLSLLATSCVESKCPDGTIEFEGRCVEGQPNPDAGPDGEVYIECVATCGGATPVCDTSVGACVACIADEQCGGATPSCDLASKTCVACADDSDCSGATPACHPTTRTCVGCAADSHCGGDTPACNVGTATCVGCANDQHCAATDEVCDTGTATCVECLDSGDCTSPTASRCNAGDRTCSACQADADCSHLGATPVCNEAAGTCVACTADTEAARCGANTCSALTFTCTSTPRYSVTSCSACETDSDCRNGMRCAYHGVLGGTPELVCMLDATQTTCNTADSRPYTVTKSTTNAAGQPVTVCEIPWSSCVALRSYERGQTCTSSDTCGPAGSCLTSGWAGHCSIACTSDFGCAANHVCRAAKCNTP